MVPRREPKIQVANIMPKSPKVTGTGLKGITKAMGPKMQVIAVVRATNVNSFAFSL